MKKKGQVKFGETFGIIFIVYIVLVIGFIWYNNINSKQVAQIFEDDQRDRAFERYYFITNLDMIHLSQRGYIDSDFDYYSLDIMQNYTQTDEGFEYFRSKLGESTITVNISSMNFSNSGVVFNHINYFVLYNNTPKQDYNIEKFTTLIPIRDSLNNKNYMGVLEVITYTTIS